MNHLGLKLSANKCSPPTQILKWLGFLINIKDMVIKIPDDKLEETLNECNSWKLGNLATRKDVQNLTVNFSSYQDVSHHQDGL